MRSNGRMIAAVCSVMAMTACGTGGSEVGAGDDRTDGRTAPRGGSATSVVGDEAARPTVSDTSTMSRASALPTAPPETTAPDNPSLPCVVDEAVVAASTDSTVAKVGLSLGASGGTDGVGFAYAGCEYTTADGRRYAVATLLGPDDAPTVAPFAEIASVLDGPDSAVDVGDGALFARDGRLVISAHGRSFAIGFDRVALPDDARPVLVDLARAVVDSPATDTAGWCDVMRSNIPAQWGEVGALLRGSGSDGEVAYELCGVSISAIPEARVQLGIAEDSALYDAAVAERSDRLADRPQAVPNLGDEAFWYDDKFLLVRIGEQGIVVQGVGPDGESLSQQKVTAVAVDLVPAM